MNEHAFSNYVLSPIQVLFVLLRIAFPTTILRMDDRTNFRSRGTTKSLFFCQDLGHLCRGRRNHISGHSDFGNSEQSGSLHLYLSVGKYCTSCLFVTIGSYRRRLQSRLVQCHNVARLCFCTFVILARTPYS